MRIWRNTWSKDPTNYWQNFVGKFSVVSWNKLRSCAWKHHSSQLGAVEERSTITISKVEERSIITTPGLQKEILLCGILM